MDRKASGHMPGQEPELLKRGKREAVGRTQETSVVPWVGKQAGENEGVRSSRTEMGVRYVKGNVLLARDPALAHGADSRIIT